MDWRGVGSNPAGDVYFHFEFFAPSPFRTGQRSRCKWNQACPFTWSHSCFRPQIWFIIQGLVYKYLQYSFNQISKIVVTKLGIEPLTPLNHCTPIEHDFFRLFGSGGGGVVKLSYFWLAEQRVLVRTRVSPLRFQRSGISGSKTPFGWKIVGHPQKDVNILKRTKQFDTLHFINYWRPFLWGLVSQNLSSLQMSRDMAERSLNRR